MSLGGPETGHGTEWEHRNEATEGHMWGQGKGGDDWGHERLPQVYKSKTPSDLEIKTPSGIDIQDSPRYKNPRRPQV